MFHMEQPIQHAWDRTHHRRHGRWDDTPPGQPAQQRPGHRPAQHTIKVKDRTPRAWASRLPKTTRGSGGVDALRFLAQSGYTHRAATPSNQARSEAAPTRRLMHRSAPIDRNNIAGLELHPNRITRLRMHRAAWAVGVHLRDLDGRAPLDLDEMLGGLTQIGRL